MWQSIGALSLRQRFRGVAFMVILSRFNSV